MSARYALAILLLATPLFSRGAALSRPERGIVAAVDARREAAIELLARVVDIPSATENHAGVREVGEIFGAELRALGFETKWVELPGEVNRAGHLVAERKGTKGARILLIGHLDSVLQGEPYRREGSRGYGSGAADMKGGDVVIVEALRALHTEGALEGRQIIVVMTGDEEKPGSPHDVTRAALVDAASRSDVALAFEGYAPGTAVTGRRGICDWRLETTGSQGHSSTIFGEARGSGAIFEASRILSAFHDGLREPYLTYNPGLFLGGTETSLPEGSSGGTATGKHNVVARSAIVEGDLRFLSAAQLARAQEAMRAIVAKNLPKTTATIRFDLNMPSMAPTEGNRALLHALDGVSRDLGTGPMGEHDPSQRGAGDISFVAHLVDGLDGLGALGEQEHAPGEYIELDELPNLIKRTALLIHRLTR
ncbi:MAG: M20/M25/M40 family metallo-hydrolase [Acidobacteria bacterium]|nr:M20/M25/M40 family metallo-hydrolase [Acidobacteriota bacterium]